eukprot:2535249-Rhodomonas_salina.1
MTRGVDERARPKGSKSWGSLRWLPPGSGRSGVRIVCEANAKRMQRRRRAPAARALAPGAFAQIAGCVLTRMECWRLSLCWWKRRCRCAA